MKQSRNKSHASIVKADEPQKDLFQWIFPQGWNSMTHERLKHKEEGLVKTSILRSFSVMYPIARACIDYLKTKSVQLKWNIIYKDNDDDEEGDEKVKKFISNFFKHPLGWDSSYRSFIEAILEDYLVLGGITLERMTTRGSSFLGFKMVDPASIKIILDEYGRTPEPPAFAYEQWINGQKIADLTASELRYWKKNTRTNSAYGLAPLESLIVQIESALKASLFNLSYLSEGTTPEGIITLPESYNSSDIQRFEDKFNALMSGNPMFQRKIKFLPNGSQFQATKSLADMAFEKFEMWLTQQTCAVFGVPPQDIGITYQVNKATAEVQSEKGKERGLRPIAQFIEEIFTQIIQEDLGFEDYNFVFTDVDPVDLEREAKIQEIRLRTGIVSVDEVRKQEGLDPIGLSNYVTNNVVLASDLISGKIQEQKDQAKRVIEDSLKKPNKDDETEEIKRWKKMVINCFKGELPLKKFYTNKISDDIYDDIEGNLKLAKNISDINATFQPYLSGEAKLSAKVAEFIEELEKINVIK